MEARLDAAPRTSTAASLRTRGRQSPSLQHGQPERDGCRTPPQSDARRRLLRGEGCARGYVASWSRPWYKTQRVLCQSPMVRDAQGINPLLTRHQRSRVRRPLICKEATRPHLSMNTSRPMWTLGPLSRPDGMTGTRPSLGATDHAEAGGTTPTTIAAHRRSLRVPASSARPSVGPSSRPDSESPLTSPST